MEEQQPEPEMDDEQPLLLPQETLENTTTTNNQTKRALIPVIICLLPSILWIFIQSSATGIATQDYIINYFALQENLTISFANLSICKINHSDPDYIKYEKVQAETSNILKSLTYPGLPITIFMTIGLAGVSAGPRFYVEKGHRFGFLGILSGVALFFNFLLTVGLAVKIAPSGLIFKILLILNDHIVPKAVLIPLIFQILNDTFGDETDTSNLLFIGNVAIDLLAYGCSGVAGKVFAYFTGSFWLVYLRAFQGSILEYKTNLQIIIRAQHMHVKNLHL